MFTPNSGVVFDGGTDGYVNLSTPRSSISKQSPSAINSLPRTKLSSSSKPRQRERSPSTAKDTYLRVAASGEDVMGKAERPRGSSKAARVAADGLIAAAACRQVTMAGRSCGASSSPGASGEQGVGPAGRGGGALDSSLSAGRGAPGRGGHGAGGGGAGASGSSVAAPAGSSAQLPA